MSNTNFFIIVRWIFSVNAAPAPIPESTSQGLAINPIIESVTSMAIDENENFLYYTQCCECVISRINIKEEGTAEPQVFYSENGKKCYDLAIVGDKLLFSVKEENTTYRRQRGHDGKWKPVELSSPLQRYTTGPSYLINHTLPWRWAFRPTASIKQIQLGDSKGQDPLTFERDVYPISFFTKSPAKPGILYVGFEGPSYFSEASKVVSYNMVSKEKETILEGIDVSQAMIVDDFIIYTTPSDVSPGNTGKLYRKRLGSNERAILVARELADPQTLCQTENEILVNGLGDTWNNSSSL